MPNQPRKAEHLQQPFFHDEVCGDRPYYLGNVNLSQKLRKKKFAEKASSGMGEMCPKIFGG